MKETWEETENKVQQLFQNQLDITTKIHIERAHRTGKNKIGDKRPRTIVLKMLNCKDRCTILKNANKLRGSGIYINEDFSVETINIRKRLWNDVLKLRQDGKYAVLQYDRIIQHDFRK